MLTLVPLAAAPMALGPSWLAPDQLLDSVGPWALWVAALVIFAECGLLLGFFLPGDSLLFTVGLFSHGSEIGRISQNIFVCCIVLTAAAFLGNLVGYEIGRASGPAIFSRPNSRIFKQEYVDKTVAFFDTYGARAIVLARFVPIVRTFITVTAGVAQMDRRRYLTYSGIGAFLWASGVTILGYLLGGIAFVRGHIEVMLIIVVLVSVLPVGIEFLRARRNSSHGDGDEYRPGAQSDSAPFLPEDDGPDPFAPSDPFPPNAPAAARPAPDAQPQDPNFSPRRAARLARAAQEKRESGN